MCVNNLSKVALDSAAAGIEPATSTPQVASPTP